MQLSNMCLIANNQYISTHSRLLLNDIPTSHAMAFSSSNPYQYLAVYFDFFAGPVMQLSNMYLIISIYIPIPGYC